MRDPGPKPGEFIKEVRMNEIDHREYPRRMRGLTEEALRFTITDAKEALAAMPDSPKAGYYQDEIHYASMELKRRRQNEARRVKDQVYRDLGMRKVRGALGGPYDE
jgi:hypothetical protein